MSRIQLRPLTIHDADFVFRLYTSVGFTKFIGDRGVVDLASAEQFLVNSIIPSYQGGLGLMAVERKEDGVLTGICGLLSRPHLAHHDLGYGFLSEFEGEGYAFEAANCVIDRVKKMAQLPLLAIVTEDNVRSIKLLKRLGFELDCVDSILDDGRKLLRYILLV